MTLEFDIPRFRKAVTEYLAAVQHDAAYVLNKKGFFIARRGLAKTPKEDPLKIRGEMEAWRIAVMGKRGKYLKKTKTVLRGTRAYNIIQGRRIKAGLAPLPKAQAEAAALKMTHAKIRSAGTLKVGWHGMLRSLAFRVKEKYAASVSQITGGMRKVAGPGAAVPAKEANWHPECKIIYYLQSDGLRGVHPHVETAMQVAFSEEIADMEAFTAAQMQKTANAHSGAKP